MNHAFEIIPLTVEARGEIITNNLPEFRELVREALGNINRDLKTDEDFGQAEKDVKALKAAEEAVRAAALKAFDDQLKALVDGLNETADEIKAPRLELEKLIAKRKEAVRAELIEDGMSAITCAASEKGKFRATLEQSIKGLKTLDSMREKIRIASAVINDGIGRNRKLLDEFEEANGRTLTPDREKLEVTDHVTLPTELSRRLERAQAEAREKRLREEAEAARAAEAKARAEAEAAKKPTADPRNPHDLPKPPKIGGIPTGANAAPPANVVPMHDDPEPHGQTASLTEDEEWAEVAATVKAAFALIKEHRERLIHARNHERLVRFGDGVNAAWKSCKVEEVAP